ncbi:hypothetical protein HPP92_021632 [Vanilla planifolia]|uniref:Uncharacterized protein n=1 Tax=Vanilla planifolia TaxID=51239 RepID=A0A835Q2Y1_VANPL|nr:hypothetical protein HPP92_021632 [Vanilla planifolia]
MAATTSLTPAVIVGGGRVGRALLSMGVSGDVLVGRGETVPAEFAGPIFVCTRNDDLDAVLESTPLSRWNAGEPPVDGKTDTNPEGLTAAFGKWASVVASRLHHGGLSCKVLEKVAFQKQMLEKLIWISAFMLVGARHPGATVGVVEKDNRSEDWLHRRWAMRSHQRLLKASNCVTTHRFYSQCCWELISNVGIDSADYGEELSLHGSLNGKIKKRKWYWMTPAAAAEKGLTFDEGMEERLCAYARAVSQFPTAVKEFKWRNGWFYSLSEKAIAQGKRDPCPLHTAWLKEINVI